MEGDGLGPAQEKSLPGNILHQRPPRKEAFLLWGGGSNPTPPAMKTLPQSQSLQAGGQRQAGVLTDSKAMEIHCTLLSFTPTAPWESCPGRRFGSGRFLHSGCNI